MASFPGAVKTFASRSSGQTIAAAHVNDLQDEVNAIEDGLLNGTAPLNSSNSTFNALSVSSNCTVGSALTVSSHTRLNGILSLSTSPDNGSTTGEIVLANAKAIRGYLASGSSGRALLALSAANLVQLGGGHHGPTNIEIRGDTASALAAAGSSANDGIVVLDVTNNRLCYYVGGNRFALTGSTF